MRSRRGQTHVSARWHQVVIVVVVVVVIVVVAVAIDADYVIQSSSWLILNVF